MSLNQRVTAEFSTCTPSAPPTADLSIQTIRPEQPAQNTIRLPAQASTSDSPCYRQLSFEDLKTGAP
jgi:hypothetical protein